MPLLDDIQAPVQTPAQIAADQIKEHVRQTYRYIVAAFNEGSHAFWLAPNNVLAADIAAALSTDAEEVFELHKKLGMLITSVTPAAIAPGMSAVGVVEYNEDGTVTVVEESPLRETITAIPPGPLSNVETN